MGGDPGDAHLLSDDQERQILRWLEDDTHTSEVARRELIHWYAEQLLRRDGSEAPAVVPRSFADGFLERHAGVVAPLVVMPWALAGAMPSTTTTTTGLRRLYGDAPPPERQPAPYPAGDVLYCMGGKCVVRHGDLVTKYTTSKVGFGPGDEPNEAAALRFVRAHTTIPVPAVVDSAWDRITMEYVPGQTLKQAWPLLTPEQRAGVLDQLRGYIAQLQALRRPPDAPGGQGIGRLDGQGVAVLYVMPRVAPGPLPTVAAFHDWLVGSASTRRRGVGSEPAQTVYWSQIMSQLRATFPVVLAHGDIAARNILVRDGRIVALIDWELAGWCPAYWDYVFALRGMDNVDWATLGHHLPSLFPVRYDHEYMLLKLILRMK